MDNFTKRVIAIAALLIGAGIFFHYVVYLPGIEREKREAIASEAAKKEMEKQRIANEYQNCLNTAQDYYASNWAKACKGVATEQQSALLNCMSTPSIINNQFMGRQWCNRQYGDINPSPDCTLPGKRAENVNKYYDNAKQQCEIASRIGS